MTPFFVILDLFGTQKYLLLPIKSTFFWTPFFDPFWTPDFVDFWTPTPILANSQKWPKNDQKNVKNYHFLTVFAQFSHFFTNFTVFFNILHFFVIFKKNPKNT